MKEYNEQIRKVLECGELREDRTGVGTISLFGESMARYDLSKGFPAVTTKRLAWKSVVSELLWFLEGSTDERRLAEIHYGKPREQLVGKTTIWTANADKQGVALGEVNNDNTKMLGPVYGAQMRGTMGGVDQIQLVVDTLRNNPTSRRIIMNNWNVDAVDRMALPPCHTLSQFYVNGNKLSCLMYQRSADMFLGVPFNIASYSLLTHMIASHLGMDVGAFTHVIGDAHIYKNHVEAVEEQLNRGPRPSPKLKLPTIDSFDVEYIKQLKPSDFVLEGYDPHPTITAPMAV